MTSIVKFFALFLSLLCSNLLHAAEYKDGFAFICKSFKRDADRSLVMYKSVEHHFKEKVPFYFIIPQEDLRLFDEIYTKALSRGEISALPKFLIEDDIFRKCGIRKEQIDHLRAKPRSGWLLQQVVKLCFNSTMLAKDYMSIDSDIYFVKDFDKTLFYNNDTLKTVGRMLGDGSEKAGAAKFNKVKKLRDVDSEQSYRYHSHSFIRYVFDGGNDKWYDFVSGFALWSSDILFKMSAYIDKNFHYNMADLINLVPWEMQWYGQFIQSQIPDNFHPFNQSKFLTGIADLKEDDKYKHCQATHGVPGVYGIQYQPHAEGRKSLVYEMPNTKYCKTKHFFRSIGYRIKGLFVDNNP